MASVYHCFTPMSVSVYFGKSSNLALHFCNGIWIYFSTLDKHHLAQPATVAKELQWLDKYFMVLRLLYIDNFNYWLLSVCEETFNQYNKKMFMKNLH